ncbi:MAG: ribonuclease P protein component [Gallionella sp.]
MLFDISPISTKFTTAHRLRRKDSFNQVLHAENILDECFKVYFIQNVKSVARLGIIASKKLLPKATDRNRVKRIIRETFRHHNIRDRSLDLVVMARFVHFPKKVELGCSLENLLSRIERRCAKQ